MAVEAPTLSGQERSALREQLRNALQTIPTDDSPDNWSDVYVPLSHRQALNPERMLVEKIWLQNKASVLQKIESMRDKALVPWQNGAPNSERMERLLATLEQIGIVRPRKKNGNERIELPDIYRLAYKIGRRGGISTQRKPKP
ncbi:hypothetical protein [Verminephrobacter aporrectodeae]|uniref:hypothetical protein n=1 Tax=Verminephrobacter aporrectodeae TaxID=1110389 RepID=UPI001110F422|nr:hypothetical protein [Verminephrobacter aporrectodeae]